MELTAQEKSTGELTSTSLDLSQQRLSQQRFVVLKAVPPAHWVVTMREIITAELQNHYASKLRTLIRQRHHGGFQPPLTMPSLDPQIIANPLVFQVLEQLLGQSFFGCLPYGRDTTFPGSQEQNVHRDCGYLFPELTSAAPAVLAVVNPLLDDFTAANGATEIWPGSHLLVDADQEETRTLQIPLARWRDHPSTLLPAPAVSIVIRDTRTWHCGGANSTASLRTMLALVYYRQYFMPDNLVALTEPIRENDWQQLSERVRWTYRPTRANAK